MSNPVVSVTTSIPPPPTTMTVRNSFSLKSFSDSMFFLYEAGGGHSAFDPTSLGEESYIWYMLGDALNEMTAPLPVMPPVFVTQPVWDNMVLSPSGFITPNNSIMPKIISPSTLMVDNGISMTSMKYSGVYNDGSDHPLLNWVLDSFGGSGIGATEWFKYAQVGANFGSQYISSKAKNDNLSASGSNEFVLHIPSPVALPTSWEIDGTALVGGGAFVLMLNILGTTPGGASPGSVEQQPWSIEISFGDVTMTLKAASPMIVKIVGDSEGDVSTPVNLAEGMAKEGPPQQQHMADKPPIILGVYPCWNGIVVMSGNQETPEVVSSAATYCRKYKGITIQDNDLCSPHWFDSQDPQDVKVLTTDGSINTNVDFGDHIDVVAKNCRFEIAYMPRFFTQAMAFDGWLLLSDTTTEIDYQYRAYTIYTDNGTGYHFGLPDPHGPEAPGPEEDTSYYYMYWNMEVPSNNKIWMRRAGEIFAYILRTIETRQYSIKNGNGSFELTWSGGTPGSSTSSNWKEYIRSISATIGLDGSSGTIVVDKYGVAGQNAEANQSIGAIVLDVDGGLGTISGTVFKGIAMGVSNSETSGDSTWSIPLFGLEKKLEDIALINPPYMDGETLATAVNYLCHYAGLYADLSHVEDPSVRLSATEEVNAARFDWKSGTTVKAALEDVLQDVNHGYVVMDGVVYIYTLDVNGLPPVSMLGPDRSIGYGFTNIVSEDKNPDFEDLRNYVVGLALQQVPEGKGTEITRVPTFPMISAMEKDTTPDVPWAKCWVRVFQGAMEPSQLDLLVSRMSDMSSVYEVVGSLTIPGNGLIRPFDRWGDLVISSVTNTVDIQAKTWTTSLEFMRIGIP